MIVALLLVLVSLVLGEPTCTRFSTPPRYVGGGFIDTAGSTVAVAHVNEENVQTTIDIRRTDNGQLVRTNTYDLGSIYVTTCPSRGLMASAMIVVRYPDFPGVYIIQPFVYTPTGVQLGFLFRST